MEPVQQVVPVMTYTETTPNPNTLKFVINRLLYPNDYAEFLSKEEAAEAPLALALFNIEHITQVFISKNFVSITKDDEVEWYELMYEVKNFLKSYLDSGAPIINAAYKKPERLHTNEVLEDDTDVEAKIKAALDKYIKPSVELDGGHISFVKYEDDILTVQLQGSCNGCPSANVTLKQGIENILKKFVPTLKKVVSVN